MKRLPGIALLGLAASALMFGQAPTYTIKTYAGGLQSTTATMANTLVFGGVLGASTPISVLVDPNGNTFVADFNGRKVWKIDSKGNATLVIGTNTNNVSEPTFG